MTWHSTGGLTSVNFLSHDQFESELKKLSKSSPILAGMESVKRLLEKQFDPLNPEVVIPPGKIHRVHQNDVWSLWKIEVVLPKSGLRPNQWPRMWFVVSGDKIVFLCINSHTQNYDNNTVDKLAAERVSDFF